MSDPSHGKPTIRADWQGITHRGSLGGTVSPTTPPPPVRPPEGKTVVNPLNGQVIQPDDADRA
jgi:hypothetical protein